MNIFLECNFTKIKLRVHKRLHLFASISLIICFMSFIDIIIDTALLLKFIESLSFLIQYTVFEF